MASVNELDESCIQAAHPKQPAVDPLQPRGKRVYGAWRIVWSGNTTDVTCARGLKDLFSGQI
jgi:hypothetical protein